MTDKTDIPPLAALSLSLATIVEAIAPLCVSIEARRAQASGYFWKPNYVVTAEEALPEEGDVSVVLAGGERKPAKLVGRDPTTDVAVLQVDAGSAAALPTTTASPLKPGALVVSVGSRGGHAFAGLGMVASVGPAWTSMRGGEIDARIDLSLSLPRQAEGGLALDALGQSFGMTVLGPRGRVLVIPNATVERVASQLLARGKIPRGYLGLSLQTVQLPDKSGAGAMVMSVDPAGPGSAAGIGQGDVIVSFDGKPMRNISRVVRTLGPASVGRTVRLLVRRGGDTREVDLTITERSVA